MGNTAVGGVELMNKEQVITVLLTIGGMLIAAYLYIKVFLDMSWH